MAYIEDETSVPLSDFRQSFVQRRISKRMMQTKCKKESEYLELLKQGDDELNSLMDALTIQVSWFYRNPINWEILKTEVLPGMLSQKIKNNETLIRIWSAGCARGEEPYTVAILLNELIEKNHLPLTIQIFATDIDTKSLELAQRGLYHAEALKYLPLGMVKKYFKHSNDSYQISPELKKLIHFSYFDLLNSKHLAPAESVYATFDLTFCRNVLIYYQEIIQRQLFRKLTKITTKHGFLILGDAELPNGAERKLVRKIENIGNIYQKL